VLLSLLCSGGCLALAAAGPLLGRSAPLGIFCVVTMFTGTVVARWHAGTVRLRTLALCVGAALASGVALLAGTLLGHDQPAFLGTRSFAPMAAAWTGAYVLFFAGVALRRHRAPGWLRRLGVVSYAVYLLHPLVLAAVPQVGGAAGTALVWTAITLLLAEVAHRVVERPAIALGRRLGLRRVSGSSAAASVDPAPLAVSTAAAGG
jgi:peptidoglycan/LPS O-acetylase OafA/YrhL